jgi:LmbE family N-acetylglucosaminyl deacetylase
MVIAPHPDDETLGCGATIARGVLAEREVRMVIVADCRHSHQSAVITPEALAQLRRAEVVEAYRILGLPAASVDVARLRGRPAGASCPERCEAGRRDGRRARPTVCLGYQRY